MILNKNYCLISQKQARLYNYRVIDVIRKLSSASCLSHRFQNHRAGQNPYSKYYTESFKSETIQKMNCLPLFSKVKTQFLAYLIFYRAITMSWLIVHHANCLNYLCYTVMVHYRKLVLFIVLYPIQASDPQRLPTGPFQVDDGSGQRLNLPLRVYAVKLFLSLFITMLWQCKNFNHANKAIILLLLLLSEQDHQNLDTLMDLTF